MCKRLLCLLLAALLLTVTVSCQRGREPGWDTEPTESSSASATENASASPEDTDTSPTEDPTEPEKQALHAESMTLNGVPLFTEDVISSLEAIGYDLPITDGTELSYLSLSGWVGYTMAVDVFGYSIDGQEPVFGHFSTYTESQLKEEGGDYALRFAITAPLMDLKPGSHTVTFLARLANGSVVELMPLITLTRQGITVDASRPYHSSLTHINGFGQNGTASYEGRGGSSDTGVDIIDCILNGHKVDQDRIIRISGWMAVEGGVDHYVWSANGVNWYPAVTNGQTGEPLAGYFSELGYENATENATFADLILDLTPYHDRNVTITVGGVPKDAPDTVVPFLTLTGLNVPYLPVDITYTYVSQIENDAVEDDLRDSDLSYMFQFAYGAGDTRYVTERNGEIVYAYDGIHSFQASMNGTFAMTAHIQEMRGCSFFFVRGTRTVQSVDEVPIPLSNFYETDGLGLCGGAGIYAKIADDTLTVVIKGLDPTADYRIKNHTFYFPAEGDTLTIADNGRTVYIFVEGEEITSIKLNGETEYPEHLASVAPAIKFAETAEILLANGQVATVHNTLVASTCNAQCGVAIRGGGVYFDRITVEPFSEFIANP